jgi:hypothetical protein
MKTLGISPKVALPAIVYVVIAAALAVLGHADVAAVVLAAGGVGTGAGAAARPGNVTVNADDIGEPFRDAAS